MEDISFINSLEKDYMHQMHESSYMHHLASESHVASSDFTLRMLDQPAGKNM